MIRFNNSGLTFRKSVFNLSAEPVRDAVLSFWETANFVAAQIFVSRTKEKHQKEYKY